MPTLLIVHHTPSPNLQAMFEAAADGARTDEIEGVDVLVRPALTASEVDVLAGEIHVRSASAHGQVNARMLIQKSPDPRLQPARRERRQHALVRLANDGAAQRETGRPECALDGV